MVQQILDPNGTLQHVILTTDPMLSQQPPPPPQSHHGVPITPYVSILIKIEPKNLGQLGDRRLLSLLPDRSQRWSQR